MTLGEFVTNYRKERGISVRYFASLSDMSPQQIINIEKGTGNDGKPMTSTMKTYQKIARAVGMDETEFLLMLNDDVRVNPSEQKNPATESDGNAEDLFLKERHEYVNSLFDSVSSEDQDYIISLLKRLSQSQQDQDGQIKSD